MSWQGAALLLAVVPALAADIELAPTELRIPPGEQRQVEFGTVPQRDTTVLLRIRTRIDTPQISGSSWFMALTLNGHRIEPAKSRTLVRLLNRPLVSPVAANLPSAWYGSGRWRVLYAPDFQGALQYKFYEGNPYELVIDITDLTNPAAENRLVIDNGAEAYLAKRMNASLDLVIGQATIEVKPGASPMMGSASAARHRFTTGEPPAGPAPYGCEVKPGGGLAVDLGPHHLKLTTSLSYPNAGFNLLGAAPTAEGQEHTLIGDGSACTATYPDYVLRRTIRRTPGKVIVRDAFTNRHQDQKVGLMVKHELDLARLNDPPVRLAGNGDPAMNCDYAPANPTVHVGLGEQGLGMVCEDDVFRNQAWLYCDAEAKVAGLRTEMLCLQPGQTTTLEWSLYPVASPEYYDFINLLREDWGANFTIDGAWCFFGPDTVLKMPAEEIRAKLDRLAIRYACSGGGWVDFLHSRKRIGFGQEIRSDYWADYRRRLKEATAKLHAVKPDLKVLIYYDSQRDTAADAPTLFPDSKLTNERGQQLSTEWSGVYSLTWSMVATLDNSFGKAMLEVVDTYLDEVGADGLYWDEMECTGYDTPLLSYAQPDGHSCILDPKTYTITQEVGVTTLLGESHRLAVIDKVRAKGGTLMGNGPPCTRAMLGRRVQRMVEIQHNDSWAYQGQLDSLLGYASASMEFSNVSRALQWATLLVGTRWEYTYDINPYLYPVTPIWIHHGCLVGKERIITMHSGRYGWPGETVNCTLALFGQDGKLKQRTETVAGEGAQRVKVELAEGEVAVLVRK